MAGAGRCWAHRAVAVLVELIQDLEGLRARQVEPEHLHRDPELVRVQLAVAVLVNPRKDIEHLQHPTDVSSDAGCVNKMPAGVRTLLLVLERWSKIALMASSAVPSPFFCAARIRACANWSLSWWLMIFSFLPASFNCFVWARMLCSSSFGGKRNDPSL